MPLVQKLSMNRTIKRRKHIPVQLPRLLGWLYEAAEKPVAMTANKNTQKSKNI